MKLSVINPTGKNSSMTVKDEIFGLPANDHLVAQAVRVFMNNQRQGTSSAKTRSDVLRTTKKWYKQKGTGNARHGARSAHIFVGGGVAFGPKADQNWSLNLPKKMKKKALAVAISMRASETVVSDAITELTGKTKPAAELVSKLTDPKARRVLIVVSELQPQVTQAVRNLPNVIVSHASRVNIYEVMNATHLVLTKDAVKQLEERLG